MDVKELVEVDPEKMGGTPVFTGTSFAQRRSEFSFTPGFSRVIGGVGRTGENRLNGFQSLAWSSSPG